MASVRNNYCLVAVFVFAGFMVAVGTQGIDSCTAGIFTRSDGCSAVSRGSVIYTCKNTDSIVWKSDIFLGTIIVIRNSTTSIPDHSITGVTVAEKYIYKQSIDCLKSTLTFSGSLENLQRLNKVLLRCEKKGNVTIVVPSVPEPPIVDQLLPINCGGPIGTRATLEWAPPTNTGGEGVSIERYIVNVITASGTGYTCLPDQCNVTTPSTTITGLQCNTSYTVTVTAVNCVGQSVPSTPVTLNVTNIPNATLTPPPILKACLTDNNITVRWMRPSVWSYDSTCAEVQQYSLTISNSSGGIVVLVTNIAITSLSVRIPEDIQYTISLRATTVCGSSNSTITMNRDNNSCMTAIDIGCSGIVTPIAVTLVIVSLLVIVFLTLCVATQYYNKHQKKESKQTQNGNGTEESKSWTPVQHYNTVCQDPQ